MKISTWILFLMLLTGGLISAQTTGDYRSAVTAGPSNTSTSWQVYNGASWTAAGLTTTGTTTLGSNVITGVGTTSGVIIGQYITGTGIPGSATVTAFDASTITISAVASASATVSITIGATPSPSGTVTIQTGNTDSLVSTTAWGNLVVNGTLAMGKANNNTNRTLTINGNITVNTGGIITPSANSTATYNQKHAIILSGNLINNGTITGYQTGTFGTVKVTCSFSKNGSASFSGTGTTTLQELTVNLGTSASNVLTISANITAGSSAASTAGGVNMTNGSIALSSATLTYGSNATLVYNSTNYAQTTSDVEFPAAGGPKNVTVSNLNGITLHASRTIPGTLNMTAGNISLNGMTLNLGSSPSTLGTLTYSAGNLVGPGTFRRWIGAVAIAGTTGTFPMGSSANYRGLAVLGTPSVAGTVSVTYNDLTSVSLPFGAGFVENAFTFINRYDANWVVAVGDGFTGSALSIGINGNGIPELNNINDVNISAATGPAPGFYLAPSGTTATPIGNRQGLDQSSLPGTYYFASTATSLPVELSGFSANLKGSVVELKWQTASETDNQGFEILRAGKDNKFEKIGFVKGSGNSNSVKLYSFNDSPSFKGIIRYKLNQVDINGKTKSSKIVEVNVVVPTKLSLGQNYPNPFNPSTVIRFDLPKASHINLTVYNALGQKVATLADEFLSEGAYAKTFDGSGLSTGIYVYQLSTNESVITKKMMLIK